MMCDSNHHFEVEIAALREENARSRAELYVMKSECTESSALDIPIGNNAEESAVRPVTIRRKKLALYQRSQGRAVLGYPLRDNGGMQAVQG